MPAPSIIDNYVGKKLGNFLHDLVTDLNPVRLHRAAVNQSTEASTPNLNDLEVGKNIRAIRQLVKETRGGEANKGMTLGEYFSGKQRRVSDGGNIGGFVDDQDIQKRAATVRKAAAGTIAAYGISPMIFGEDNVINRGVEAGGSLALHGGITSAAINAKGGSRYFGIAYGGLAAVNAIRSGNNFGPF